MEDERETKLKDYKEKLKGSGDVEELGRYKEKLDAPQKYVELSNVKEVLGVHEDNELDNYKEKLEDNRSTALNDRIEKLNNTTNENLVLSHHKEEIKDDRNTKLSDYKERLNDDRKNSTKLSDYKEVIEDERETRLNNYKEKIRNSKETEELGRYKEKLDAPQKFTELSDVKEVLDVNENNSLNNYKEKLEDNRNITLNDHLEKLNDTSEDIVLSKYRENLKDDRELHLSNTKERIRDDRDIELSNQKESIVDGRNTKLSEHKERLNDDRITRLSDYKESLNDVRDPITLSNYKENLEDERETRLNNYKENLVDNRKLEELPNYKEKIEDPGVVSLPEYKEELVGVNTTETKLSDYKEELEVENKVGSLPNYKENIVDNRENDLSRYKEPIVGHVDEILNLPDYQEKLRLEGEEHNGVIEELNDYQEGLDLDSGNHSGVIDELGEELAKLEPADDREIELGNYKEGLNLESGGNSGQIEELSDYQEKITDDREVELPDYKETIIDDREIELPDYKETIIDDREIELGDYKEELNDEREIGLSDFKENIEDSRENKLSDYQEKLIDERETELEDYQEKLNLDSGGNSGLVNDLPDTVIALEPNDDKEEKLSDYQEKLNLESGGNTGEVEKLSDYKETITDDREIELSDFRDDIVDNRETELSDFRDDIVDDREVGLGDFIDQISDERDTELSDYQEKLKDAVDPLLVLDTTLIRQPEEKAPETQDPTRQYTYFDPQAEGNELYDSVLERPEEKAPETQDPTRPYTYFDPQADGNELYDSVLERPDQPEGTKAAIFEKTIETANGDISDLIATVKASQNEEDFYNNLLKLFDNFGEWGKKIEGIMSAYLTSSKIEIEQVEEYEKKLAQEYEHLQRIEGYNTIAHAEIVQKPVTELETTTDIIVPENQNASNVKPENEVENNDNTEWIPKSKLASFNLLGNGLNANAYLRFIAENTIGYIPLHGSAKELLMNETLALLIAARDEVEKLTKSERYRLPGVEDQNLLTDFVQGGVANAATGAIKRAIGAAVGNSVDTTNPMNRPDGEPVTAWQEVNNRTTSVNKKDSSSAGVENEKKLWDDVGETLKQVGQAALGLDSGERTYSFVANYLNGIGVKLTLSELCGKDSASVNSVDDLYSTLRNSPYLTMPDKFTTTSHNGYVSTSLDTNAYWEIILEPYCGPDNGDMSYLPAIHEINTRNIAIHGINTAYSKWIPFISFDLQKARMHSKSINLYDGEIFYPVSMEYINELRLTIVDDQYKSWKMYFESCADAAIYNSEPHDKDYYKNGKGVTSIDKSSVCVAMYKNVTFRCVIYIMTPQLSTIKKYDLLVTLKDMVEENVGDPTPSAVSDLTVSFSIVGENPKTEIKTEPMKGVTQIEKTVSGTDYTSIINSGVDDVIGIFT